MPPLTSGHQSEMSADWVHGPRKLAMDLRLTLRVLRGAQRRHGLRDGARRLARYLADPRAIPRGGGNRYLAMQGHLFAIPALPPLDSPGFVRHLLDDMDGLLGDGLAPLSLAMLCITPRCAHHCSYCYNAQDHRSDEVLSGELLVEAVRGMVAAGVQNIFLSGGEPMLRPEVLPALLAASPDVGFWLVSTGWGMEPDNMGALARRGLRGVMISLDGLDAAAHDAVKGRPGAFAQACRAMGACRDAGLVVGVNCVVGAHLLQREALEAFIVRVGALGAHFVSLNSPHPVGDDDSLQPLPVAYLQRIEALALATRRHAAWKQRPLAYSPDAWEALRGCVGGQEFVYVSPLGEVMACPFLREPVGRIQDRPMGELLVALRGARAGCRVCRSLQRAMGAL